MAFFKEFFGSTSYREAQAWVFVVVNAVVMTVYGLEIVGGELPALAGLIVVSVCTTFFTILLIIPTAIVFNRTANERADERDRRIHTEGAALAFWTVFVLASLSLVGYIFHASGDLLFHFILMSILAAQFIYAFSVAVKYRRSGAPLFMRAQD
jgi:hypothetical protein